MSEGAGEESPEPDRDMGEREGVEREDGGTKRRQRGKIIAQNRAQSAWGTLKAI